MPQAAVRNCVLMESRRSPVQRYLHAMYARPTCRTGRSSNRTRSYCARGKLTGCTRGFDRTLLGDELQPDRIVTAADLSGRRILHLLGLPPVDGTAPTCGHSLRRESVARVLRLARCIRWWY